jgi:hypothetical protein
LTCPQLFGKLNKSYAFKTMVDIVSEKEMQTFVASLKIETRDYESQEARSRNTSKN